MKRIGLPLAVFIGYLAIIGYGSVSRSYAKTADLLLLSLDLVFLVILSVVVLRERWIGGATKQDNIRRRIRRWWTDDTRDPRRGT
jgi:hypothetical protein